MQKSLQNFSCMFRHPSKCSTFILYDIVVHGQMHNRIDGPLDFQSGSTAFYKIMYKQHKCIKLRKSCVWTAPQVCVKMSQSVEESKSTTIICKGNINFAKLQQRR